MARGTTPPVPRRCRNALLSLPACALLLAACDEHASPRSGAAPAGVRVESAAPGKRPDVFVLLLDALRFDGMRPFRPDSHVGASMTALARDSVLLETLHSSSSWTRPAVATLFTGLRADRHRVADRGDVLTDEAVTLAELLKKEGYSTSAWSTNPNVLPIWGLAQGFDEFVDQESSEWEGYKTDGSKLIASLRAALARPGDAPRFYYAHFMDPHTPYLPNAEQKKAVRAFEDLDRFFPRPVEVSTANEDWMAFRAYTGELIDTDDHVGEFVKMLKAAGRYDESLVLVVADHGEEFLDHGGRDHGRTLYEEVLRVPALVKLPGNRHAGTAVEDSLTFADLFPTILRELGMEHPPGLDGAAIAFDRKSPGQARPHVAQLGLDGRRQSAILDLPWKLIRDDTTGKRELYNLESDPRERTDAAAANPDMVEKLTGAMDLIMTSGQEGWHLLICGTLEKSSVDLAVRPSAGTPRFFGFAEGEAGPETGGDGARAWRLKPDLAPVSVNRPVSEKMTAVSEPRKVEALFAADATIEVVSKSGTAFDYRLGAVEETRSATRVVFDPASADAMVPHAARIECPSVAPAPPVPLLRAWYVPPVAKVATDSLDPAMQERLRALGYLQ